VESFSASHVCRFCLGDRSEFQVNEVRTGAFCPRTILEHRQHLKTVQEDASQSHCFGVKRACPLTEKLKHFDVLCGYPPDLMHDLFEGIVPLEIALCLNALIKDKYFTLDELNASIKEYPYKWTDKTNAPQPIPQTFAARKNIGGNAHENWAVLRLLPLVIGERIPENEPKWQIILNLKEIVELVFSPVRTDLTLCFLDSKISEHTQIFDSFSPAKAYSKASFPRTLPSANKGFWSTCVLVDHAL
jgi:hypothetical protein